MGKKKKKKKVTEAKREVFEEAPRSEELIFLLRGVERRWAIFVKGRHQKYSKKNYLNALGDDK